MNARELHDHYSNQSLVTEPGKEVHSTILRALALLASVEESGDELVRELRDYAEWQQDSGKDYRVIERAAAALVALRERAEAAERERDDALKAVDYNWVTHQRVVAAERVLKQFFLNYSPWPDVESREDMQSFIDEMTTEEIGRWGKAHPHHLCAALLIRAATAERKAEEAARILLKINQALLPDPHDERDVSPEWQVKAIRAAIAAKGEP